MTRFPPRPPSFLSMLTQLSATVAFPAYSIVLGFWGVYSAYTMHPHALFG